MNKSPRTCTVDGCSKGHFGRGYCRSHYRKLIPDPNKRQRARTWYFKNKESIQKRFAQWIGTAKGRYHVLCSAAKSRSIELSVTLEEYSKIVSDGVCSYCGSDLPKTGAGLDRLDSKKGYCLGNVVACCSACNFAKGNLECAGFCFPRTVQLLQELIASNTRRS